MSEMADALPVPTDLLNVAYGLIADILHIEFLKP